MWPNMETWRGRKSRQLRHNNQEKAQESKFLLRCSVFAPSRSRLLLEVQRCWLKQIWTMDGTRTWSISLGRQNEGDRDGGVLSESIERQGETSRLTNFFLHTFSRRKVLPAAARSLDRLLYKLYIYIYIFILYRIDSLR